MLLSLHFAPSMTCQTQTNCRKDTGSAIWHITILRHLNIRRLQYMIPANNSDNNDNDDIQSKSRYHVLCRTNYNVPKYHTCLIYLLNSVHVEVHILHHFWVQNANPTLKMHAVQNYRRQQIYKL